MKHTKLFRKVAALLFLLLTTVSLSACAVESDNSVRVYNHVKSSKTITWGVKFDTALFGIKSVKTNKLEGFEIDLARLLTKEILGKDGKAKFLKLRPKPRSRSLRTTT